MRDSVSHDRFNHYGDRRRVVYRTAIFNRRYLPSFTHWEINGTFEAMKKYSMGQNQIIQSSKDKRHAKSS